LEGDPETDAPWPALASFLEHRFPTPDGRHTLTLARVAVDVGALATNAYTWAQQQRPGLVMLVRGGPPGPYLVARSRAVDVVETRGTVARRHRGLRGWQVNGDSFKRELYGRLRLEGVAPGAPLPRGWVSIPAAVGDEFLRQLTAEALVPKSKRSDELEWQKIYRRNEALDCWVYARAAAFRVMRGDQFTDADWQALEVPRGLAPAPPPAPPSGTVSSRSETHRPPSEDQVLADVPPVAVPVPGQPQPVAWRKSRHPFWWRR
jgi:phage terminase large subunit GpA-like protein